MKTIVFAALVSALLATDASAEQDNGPKTEASAVIPPLATVVSPGEEIAPGDVIALTRPYLGGWALKCDLRLSKDQRVCILEQVIRDGDKLALWRVAQSAEGKPIVIVSMPASFEPSSGLTLSFSGLDKTIAAADWRCAAGGCVAAFPFTGLLASAVTGSEQVRFTYNVKAADGKTSQSVLTAPMIGFGQALDASKNPLAKTVANKADAAVAKPKAAAKPKQPAEPKKTQLY